MKVIIDISEDVYTRLFDNGIHDNEIAIDDVCEMARALRLGTPLDDVKAEIEKLKDKAEIDYGHALGFDKIYAYKRCLEILDNIGKESEE